MIRGLPRTGLTVAVSFVLIRVDSRLESAGMKLVIATRNKHKLEEIREIFACPAWRSSARWIIPTCRTWWRTATTFEANAIKKAVTLAKATGSGRWRTTPGLEVDALNGEPGVYSARYAGEPVSYRRTTRSSCGNSKRSKDRPARFRCVIALSGPEGNGRTVDGRCEGAIGFERTRGSGGFGYDPLFIPDGHTTDFRRDGFRREECDFPSRPRPALGRGEPGARCSRNARAAGQIVGSTHPPIGYSRRPVGPVPFCTGQRARYVINVAYGTGHQCVGIVGCSGV